MIRTAVYGCGHLGSIIAEELKNGKIEDAELCCIGSRSYVTASGLASRLSVPAAASVDLLLKEKPDYIFEAVRGEAAKEIILASLNAGIDIIVLSTGVFSDTSFYKNALEAAKLHSAKVHLVPGAIGGFDILGAAQLMGGFSSARVIKTLDEDFTERVYGKRIKDFFGSCPFNATSGDAYRTAPGMMNIAVSAALATKGLNETHVTVTPSDCASFTVSAEGGFGRSIATVEFGERDVDYAAYSALYVLKRLTSHISIG